ncbi:hypothetical protein V8F20_010833 [Naviculisporaceae sp. PSN 640]
MSLRLPAPTFTSYIPPTTPPLTQFTPAPTCYPTTAGQQMWHVTGLCYPYPHPPGGDPKDWEVPRPVCTYTRAGNPQENKPECGNRWGGPGNVEGIIGSCPVGFTSAGVDPMYGFKPFDRTSWGPTPTTEVFDATASAIICCPSVSGLQFKARTTGNVYIPSTTFHNGVLFTMDVPVPHCYAHPATALDGKTVTMGVYHDSRVFDRKVKRDEEKLAVKRQESIDFADWPWETPGWGGWGDMGKTTTAVFNAQRDTIWADEVRYHYTVFHGTHTCYENCHDYFTNSYYNTDPNFAPTTTPETTTTSTPPFSKSSHAQPSGGFSYPYGGGGTGSPPYPTKGYDNGAPYPSKAYDHDVPYPTQGNSDGEYGPGKGNEGQGGNKPPVYSGRPPLQSSINEPVQAGASGIRVGGLAVLSTLAAGFLGITLAL